MSPILKHVSYCPVLSSLITACSEIKRISVFVRKAEKEVYVIMRKVAPMSQIQNETL